MSNRCPELFAKIEIAVGKLRSQNERRSVDSSTDIVAKFYRYPGTENGGRLRRWVPYLKRKKRNPYRITLLSVCPSVRPSVKTLFLRNAWSVHNIDKFRSGPGARPPPAQAFNIKATTDGILQSAVVRSPLKSIDAIKIPRYRCECAAARRGGCGVINS
ncbi:hypothetical protein EVAR_48502_1 [Eumeta japonica]|uniref:Uncharacterized protein n=1 Tax=Eumeta variegata TaxID=151549 RepID=A0A4C1XJ50_EUMVA|nr:hypothetical protein EVAR_48502_1 [Eumeta japonica]